MHERISVNNLCFGNASFATLAGYWDVLQPQRLGLTTSLMFEEGLEATKAAVGDRCVDVLSHQFMVGAITDDEAVLVGPRERLSQAIAMGKELGARCLYMAGGGHGPGTWEQSAEWFAAAIAPCLPEAQAAGIEIMVETSNPVYASSQLAHNLRDTIILAETAGIGVCIDIFAVWSEAGLDETIRRAMPRCHLVQVGDWRFGDRHLPNRSVPGDGVIPLERIIGWILDAGFTGAFDFELLGPRIEEEGAVAAVARAGEYVGNLLARLGA